MMKSFNDRILEIAYFSRPPTISTNHLYNTPFLSRPESSFSNVAASDQPRCWVSSITVINHGVAQWLRKSAKP